MYSEWARRRRFIYISAISGVLLLIVGSLLYAATYEPPSCVDKKKNQDELGVDCGGVCTLRCSFEVQRLNTLWTRPFEVSPGFWNSIAYVENPNLDSYADAIPYRFTYYDADNVVVGERDGTVDIRGEALVPVFEGGVETGNRVIARAFFEWKEDPRWHRLSNKFDVSIEQPRFMPSERIQKVRAYMRNEEVRELTDLRVTAVLYGLDNNAIAASQTLVPFLPPQERAELTFTWPRPLGAEVGRIELLTHIPGQR